MIITRPHVWGWVVACVLLWPAHNFLPCLLAYTNWASVARPWAWPRRNARSEGVMECAKKPTFQPLFFSSANPLLKEATNYNDYQQLSAAKLSVHVFAALSDEFVESNEREISIHFRLVLISGAHPGGHEKSSNFKAAPKAQKVIKMKPSHKKTTQITPNIIRNPTSSKSCF